MLSYGLPDLGMTSLADVLEDVRRITAASPLPLLVDIDTGWGGAFNIARAVREMIRAGAAAVHIEDQVATKRCGHRPNKAIVSADEMCDRIKAAVDAKTDPAFVVMARTDALAVEGLDAVVERAARFAEAGADAIFAEAMTELDMYARITGAVTVPVLANLTEFGKTPLYPVDALRRVGVRMALYPLSAFRAMNLAALNVYRTIRGEGSQERVVDTMQTRDELYEFPWLSRLREQAGRAVRSDRRRSRSAPLATLSAGSAAPAAPRRPVGLLKDQERRTWWTKNSVARDCAGQSAGDTALVYGGQDRHRPDLSRLRHLRIARRARRSRRWPISSSTANCPMPRALAAYRAKLKGLRDLPTPLTEGSRTHPGQRPHPWT